MSPACLEAALTAAGAVEGIRDGVTVPLRFSSVDEEVATLRRSAGLSALPHLTCVRVSGRSAARALEPICPVDLALPKGSARRTLLLHESGLPFVDLDLGRDEDGGYLLFAEGAAPGELVAYLRARIPAGLSVTIDDLAEGAVVVAVNGPFAWELLAEIEGLSILGLPFARLCRPSARSVILRAGKTGEYGYLILAPRDKAGLLWERLLAVGERMEARPVGLLALDLAQLECGSFSVHREGRAGLSALELGLTYRLAWNKAFVGKEALLAQRAAGPRRRLVGLVGTGSLKAGFEAGFEAGAAVRFEGRLVGEVIAAARSEGAGAHVGLGALEAPYAHSGIRRYTVDNEGDARPVRTASPPFVNPRSLFVALGRRGYQARHAFDIPKLARLEPR